MHDERGVSTVLRAVPVHRTTVTLAGELAIGSLNDKGKKRHGGVQVRPGGSGQSCFRGVVLFVVRVHGRRAQARDMYFGRAGSLVRRGEASQCSVKAP